MPSNGRESPPCMSPFVCHRIMYERPTPQARRPRRRFKYGTQHDYDRDYFVHETPRGRRSGSEGFFPMVDESTTKTVAPQPLPIPPSSTAFLTAGDACAPCHGEILTPRVCAPGIDHHCQFLCSPYGLSYTAQTPFDGLTFTSTSLCTPQVNPVEVQLRRELEDELNSANVQHRGEQAPRITPVTDTIFVGGYPSEEHLDEFKKLGITHMINCCAAERISRDLTRHFKMSYIEAFDERDYFILMRHLQTFSALVDQVHQEGGRVFVHCMGGVNRSITLVTAYLCERLGIPPIDVVRLLRQNGRFVLLDNASFRSQLVEHYCQNVKPGMTKTEGVGQGQG